MLGFNRGCLHVVCNLIKLGFVTIPEHFSSFYKKIDVQFILKYSHMSLEMKR